MIQQLNDGPETINTGSLQCFQFHDERYRCRCTLGYNCKQHYLWHRQPQVHELSTHCTYWRHWFISGYPAFTMDTCIIMLKRLHRLWAAVSRIRPKPISSKFIANKQHSIHKGVYLYISTNRTWCHSNNFNTYASTTMNICQDISCFLEAYRCCMARGDFNAHVT